MGLEDMNYIWKESAGQQCCVCFANGSRIFRSSFDAEKGVRWKRKRRPPLLPVEFSIPLRPDVRAASRGTLHGSGRISNANKLKLTGHRRWVNPRHDWFGNSAAGSAAAVATDFAAQK